MDKEITTEVYGLSFQIKGNRLCFVTRSSEGITKRHWVSMTKTMAKNIGKIVDEYLQHKEEEAKLTPQQLAEKYQEFMGS
jgi:hypothetical protein